MRTSAALLPALLGFFLPAARGQFAGDLESRKVEPNVSYGVAGGFSLPKTILFSVGPEEITADAEEWKKRGVDAFFLDFVARNWSSDIWATDGEPWTIGVSDKTFQKTRQATGVARRLGSEVFLKVAFDRVFEWFNDIAWKQIENHFRQMAIFARASGCDGMAIDIEYIQQQYDYGWSEYDYRGYSRADLFRKVQQRMTRIAVILYDEFPEMVLLTFPEEGFNLGSAIQVAWIEEAARRHAPGGVHYCTEWTYRNTNIRYLLGYAAQCNELFHQLLSPRAWRYWRERCSIAEGLWPFGFDYQTTHNPGMSVEEFRQGIAGSLMVSRRYNWIYSHNAREQMLGRKLDVYTNGVDIVPYVKVMAERLVITDPKYQSLAGEIRALKLRDYSADLGLTPCTSLQGPADTPLLRLVPDRFQDARDQTAAWRVALDYFYGRKIDFQSCFGTVPDWLVIGPFPSNAEFSGHETSFPPEHSLDLHADYDGVKGKVRWRKHAQKGSNASIDFKKIFEPGERVSAYALCFVTSSQEQDVQLRFASNDAGKVWIGGKKVHDYPHEGTVFLDRDIIPVRLPKGTSPILVKITNNLVNWGFVLRLTDDRGRALRNVSFSLAPEN